MAYMDGDKGPYPNRAGDYCGNHLRNSEAYACNGQTHAEAQEIQREWLSRMHLGRPRPCSCGTTKEMEAMGYVGLYLKQDCPMMTGSGKEVEIPTPPEMLEPKRQNEHGG